MAKPLPITPKMAEIQARIAAKRKYQKGIIATEIDLQRTALDKIALQFMQGRLSQMDKDAENRAELQEKIVDKQIEIRNDGRGVGPFIHLTFSAQL